MKISSRRDTIKSFDFAALTDIVLNMFIFFFISFSLLYTFNPQRLSKFDLKLPSAENVQAPEDRKVRTISVKKDGLIALDEKQVSFNDLEAELEKAAKKNPSLGIMIISDKDAAFKHIVKVLDILTGIGIDNLNIAAAKNEGR